MSELLPCPFCGQVPERMGNGVIDTACEAACILYGHCCWEDDWNRRTVPPATAKLLGELHEKMTLFDALDLGDEAHKILLFHDDVKAALAEWPDQPTLSIARSITDSDTAT